MDNCKRTFSEIQEESDGQENPSKNPKIIENDNSITPDDEEKGEIDNFDSGKSYEDSGESDEESVDEEEYWTDYDEEDWDKEEEEENCDKDEEEENWDKEEEEENWDKEEEDK